MTPPVQSAAELNNVSKLFGTFAALRNLSLVVPAGTSTVILGENGAGKSTLLRVLAGLTEATSGKVTVLGGEPQSVRGPVAYMSHAPMLYDELSAVENLRYFATLQSSEGFCSRCNASPEMSLRSVGLDPALTRPVGQYSQGMRQRTSLARVLQSDPVLLLLDEPFSNLDVQSAHDMVRLLKDFLTWPHSAGARTLVLTTHQAHLAGPLAGRTLRMQRGEVVSAVEHGVSA